ncbi:hypothetical protein SPBRAN_55 [uncultured Candidatus Thioglobus sp.]|nr:hypothetical protein SPBRAN_55 [uncultured Candidatus Thioglobus sp.]
MIGKMTDFIEFGILLKPVPARIRQVLIKYPSWCFDDYSYLCKGLYK